MKKTGLAVLLSLMMACAMAQGIVVDTVERITDIVELGKDGEARYQFPDFYWDEGALNESNNINTFLQVVELQNVYGSADERLFDHIRFSAEPFRAGATSISYQINVQTPTFISLTFSNEYMGASPSSSQPSYNLDLGRGQPFVLEQLLTPQGIQWVQKHLRDERENMAVESIQLASLERYEGAQEDLSKIKAIWEHCQPKMSHWQSDPAIFFEQFVLIRSTACINSRDDMRLISPFENKLSYAQLEPYLNDYGYCLLVDSSSFPCRPVSQPIAPAVWHGFIDSEYPVVMVINQLYGDNDSVMAWYYDENQKELISLNGHYDRRAQTLIVTEGQGDEKAVMTLKLGDNGQLTGQKKQGDQTLSVSFKAF